MGKAPSKKSRQGPAQASRPHARIQVEDDRTGMSVDTFSRAIADNLHYVLGKNEVFATTHDYYMALSYTVRDRLVNRWIQSVENLFRQDAKVIFYFSAEFLMGRQLGNNLLNSGCWDNAHQALSEAGLSLCALMDEEPDPGLGNGGLGRLAACYLDSLASLEIPAVGYGIRYEYGIFEQVFRDGWQVERPDRWLALGNPWEIHRPEGVIEVGFGGHTESYTDDGGRMRMRWLPERTVLGTPYDTMVPGYHVNTVNTLRLWSASASQDFNMSLFNEGDYVRAVAEKTLSENISKVLYPSDSTLQGKELRLQQQYFFVACSLQDLIRLHLYGEPTLENLPERAAIQLNDTHPSIAVPELMRLLMDVHGYDWEPAWRITVQALGYTNHTLLPEALEKWPLGLFGGMLPRHLEIIYEINRRFLAGVAERFPGDTDRLARMSIIEEGDGKQVRMANLACVGCHAINGVARLHTDLLKKNVLADFHDYWPEKFSNKTNGVTPRRWLLLSNPRLSRLISKTLGDDQWGTDLDRLKELESHAGKSDFRLAWREVKMANKKELADLVEKQCGLKLDPNALFDVQVKRVHEYKRQLLFALYAITLYARVKDGRPPIVPRVCVFAGKAAPAYATAKLIIKLINSVAEVVNGDPDMSKWLKIVFLPNFSVTLGEQVYPAADLSEQISTAGMEASGTGNMKFALNGALTIGTLDGANIEIRERVGDDNFFLFGLTVDAIAQLKSQGYRPAEFIRHDGELKHAISLIRGGTFSPASPALFHPLMDDLVTIDRYMICADFRAYVDCQDQVAKTYENADEWTRMSIMNTANMGYFSSDRAVTEYCRDIWGCKPFPFKVNEYRPDDAKLNPVCRLDTTTGAHIVQNNATESCSAVQG